MGQRLDIVVDGAETGPNRPRDVTHERQEYGLPALPSSVQVREGGGRLRRGKVIVVPEGLGEDVEMSVYRIRLVGWFRANDKRRDVQ